jgi:arylamine N-acetyltransferase
MAMTTRSNGQNGEQRRALDMLAGSPNGCTEAALRANGFTVALLAKIVRSGLAVASPEIVKAGGRTLSMLRLTITDTGRQALEPLRLPPNATADVTEGMRS